MAPKQEQKHYDDDLSDIKTVYANIDIMFSQYPRRPRQAIMPAPVITLIETVPILEPQRYPYDADRTSRVAHLAEEFVRVSKQDAVRMVDTSEVSEVLIDLHKSIHDIYEELRPAPVQTPWASDPSLLGINHNGHDHLPMFIEGRQISRLEVLVDKIVCLPIETREKSQILTDMCRAIDATYPEWNIDGLHFLAKQLRNIMYSGERLDGSRTAVEDAYAILHRPFLRSTISRTAQRRSRAG